jgi:hypothetical protein
MVQHRWNLCRVRLSTQPVEACSTHSVDSGGVHPGDVVAPHVATRPAVGWMRERASCPANWRRSRLAPTTRGSRTHHSRRRLLSDKARLCWLPFCSAAGSSRVVDLTSLHRLRRSATRVPCSRPSGAAFEPSFFPALCRIKSALLEAAPLVPIGSRARRAG